MIRINLLPTRQSKKQDMGRKQLLLLALLVVAALMGDYFWYGHVQHTLASRKSEVARLKSDIAQLDRIIGEVNTIEKEKKALEKKLAVLEKLRKGRSGPVKMLDALSMIMPEKVWLSSIEEKSGKMVIKGGAVTNDDLADLMEALKGNPFFSEPSLKKAAQVNDRAIGTHVEFELSCKVNYSA